MEAKNCETTLTSPATVLSVIDMVHMMCQGELLEQLAGGSSNPGDLAGFRHTTHSTRSPKPPRHHVARRRAIWFSFAAVLGAVEGRSRRSLETVVRVESGVLQVEAHWHI